MITTKQLSEYLGVVVTISFVTETLGVEPAQREKKGAFWSEENVADILNAMVKRFGNLDPKAAAQPVVESADDLF